MRQAIKMCVCVCVCVCVCGKMHNVKSVKLLYYNQHSFVSEAER